MGGRRTSYHSVLVGDSITVEQLTFGIAQKMGIQAESASFGFSVDLVLLDANVSDSYGPGPNVNTSNNTETVNDLIIAFTSRPSMSNIITTGGGTDFIYGGLGDDSVYGGGDGDFIAGGDGNDALYGGAGNDWIAFDTTDILVLGGDGRDLGYAVADDAIIADLATMELEVVIGGSGNDTISMSGAETLMVSGGAGSDTIMAQIGEDEGLRIIWGAGGADQIVATSAYPSGPLGIVVANVTGLTEANFHLFDIAMLGLDAMDWSQIDLLVLNPDSNDRISIGEVGDELTVGQSTAVLDGLGEVSFLADLTFGPNYDHWYEVGNYNQTFLGGFSGSVFTSGQVVQGMLMIDEMRTQYGSYVQAGRYGIEVDGNWVPLSPLAENLGLFGSGWNGETDYEYDLSGAMFVSDWADAGGGNAFRTHYWEQEFEGPITAPGNWFLVGGSIDGSQITASPNTITANISGVLDGNVSEWLLSA